MLMMFRCQESLKSDIIIYQDDVGKISKFSSSYTISNIDLAEGMSSKIEIRMLFCRVLSFLSVIGTHEKVLTAKNSPYKEL